jgi:protein-disulfide isomerase
MAFAAAVALAAAAPPGRAAGPRGAAEVAAMLRDIPQQGVDLGSPKAPVTLYEFADLQCPFCAQWERNALPEIIRKYVRPGKVRIVFIGMTFLGPDSAKAFSAALAAGRQNRFWNLAELLYLNQGTENTGWVTDAFVRSVGKLVSGLNVTKMLAARTSKGVNVQLAAASNLAASAGIDKTPSFAVGRTNVAPKLVQVSSLDASGIEPILNAALSG